MRKDRNQLRKEKKCVCECGNDCFVPIYGGTTVNEEIRMLNIDIVYWKCVKCGAKFDKYFTCKVEQEEEDV